MRTITLFLLIVSISLTTKSQSDTTCNSNWTENYIGHLPGIYFRSQPSQGSDPIGFLPFGTKVILCGQCEKYNDTIDDKDWSKHEGINCWKLAKHNNQIGYVYSGYLTEMPIKTDQEIGLLIEGPLCPYEINFNPNLNWYGIYKVYKPNKRSSAEAHVSRLKAVKVSITTFKEDCKGGGPPTVCISTDADEESLFLIGLNQRLSDTTLRVHRYYGEMFDGFIYPGQQISTTGDYCIQGRGAVNKYPEHGESAIDSYEIAIINRKDPSISQIISKDYFGNHQPSLVWDGDINGDNLPDFLFNDYGHYFFLLSNKAEKDNLIKEMATFNLYNCN